MNEQKNPKILRKFSSRLVKRFVTIFFLPHNVKTALTTVGFQPI